MVSLDHQSRKSSVRGVCSTAPLRYGHMFCPCATHRGVPGRQRDESADGIGWMIIMSRGARGALRLTYVNRRHSRERVSVLDWHTPKEACRTDVAPVRNQSQGERV